MSRSSDGKAWGRVPRARVGRADLLRALAVSASSADAVAKSLDMVRTTAKVEPPKKTELKEISLPSTVKEASRIPLNDCSMPFWRLTRVAYFESIVPSEDKAGASVRPTPVTEKKMLEYNNRSRPIRPYPRPIVPWSRLWPVLSPLLKGAEGIGPVDVATLVERWSRLEWLSALPRYDALGGSVIRVYVDRARRLVPFWGDQRMVLRRLQRILGQRSVVLHWCVRGLSEPGEWLEGGRRVPPVGQGDRVLALTDLGFYGTARERAEWRDLADRLRREGVLPTALVPVPRGRWEPTLAERWNAIDWSDPGYGFAGAVEMPSRRNLEKQAEDLLKLLSATLRIEPELLRELRASLPHSVADIGTEADAWSHPKLLGGSSQGSWIEPGTAKQWRREFTKQASSHRAQAISAIRRWHENRTYGLFEAELLSLSVDCGEQAHIREEEVTAARELVRGVIAAMPPRGGLTEMESQVKIWIDYLDSWIGRGLMDDPEIGPEIMHARYKADLPLVSETKPRTWQIRQRGASLALVPGSDGRGSPLASFKAWSPEVRLDRRDGQAEAQRIRYPETADTPLPDAPRVDIIGDTICLTLEREEKPIWASAAGRDPLGLWADWHPFGIVQRMRWVPPGNIVTQEPRDDGTSRELSLRIARGFWLADMPSPVEFWREVLERAPDEIGSANAETSFNRAVDIVVSGMNRQYPDAHLRMATESELIYAVEGAHLPSFEVDTPILRLVWEQSPPRGPIIDEAIDSALTAEEPLE